jgi:hypothetical protein
MAAPKKDEQKEQATVSIRDISIALDNYDDLFSDFDPRPYSTREISADLLKEIEGRVHKDVRGNFELRFFLPKVLRNEKKEEQITKRLQAYFKAEAKEIEQKDEHRKRSGFMFIAGGMAALFAYAYLFAFIDLGPLASFLDPLLVPFGWFSTWEGLERLVRDSHKFENELTFYRKLAKANYIFLSEEENVVATAQAQADAAAEAKEPKKQV